MGIIPQETKLTLGLEAVSPVKWGIDPVSGILAPLLSSAFLQHMLLFFLPRKLNVASSGNKGPCKGRGWGMGEKVRADPLADPSSRDSFCLGSCHEEHRRWSLGAAGRERGWRKSYG